MKNLISNKKRLTLIVILVIYIAIVLYITILSRETNRREMVLTPFWELHNLLNTSRKIHWFLQIFLNIMLFVPLGILLPMLCRSFRSFTVITFTAVLCSVAIEIAQYLTARGLSELDDVIHNTIGAIIGYIVFKLIKNMLIL